MKHMHNGKKKPSSMHLHHFPSITSSHPVSSFSYSPPFSHFLSPPTHPASSVLPNAAVYVHWPTVHQVELEVMYNRFSMMSALQSRSCVMILHGPLEHQFLSGIYCTNAIQCSKQKRVQLGFEPGSYSSTEALWDKTFSSNV